MKTKRTPLFVEKFEATGKKKRIDMFENEIFYLLSCDCDIEFEGIVHNDILKKWFHYSDSYGTVEYFPKSDRVHIHKLGTDGWKDKGLRWIINNLN